MPRPTVIVLFSVVALLLAACGGAADPRNLACERYSTYGSLPWGYYPGYGCGPVPPAQTIYP